MDKVCSGCGACVAICPVNCIDLMMDNEGFLRVSPKGEKCVSCGLCDKICPFERSFRDGEISECGYFRTSDEAQRMQSSSGAACAVLALQFVDAYQIVGAVYDECDKSVRHEVAAGEEDLGSFAGSKYLQSDPRAIYEAIDDGPAVIFGSPCQIAGARCYAQMIGREDSNIFIDFYCHGVPSLFLWRWYMRESGLDNANEIRFRDKRKYGWSEYAIGARIEGAPYLSGYKNDQDAFYQAYLSNLCLDKPCYQLCPFRGSRSQADLRVGDAWGHNSIDDNRGMSAVVAFGDRGSQLLSVLKRGGVFEKEEMDVVARAQVSSGLAIPAGRETFIEELRRGTLTIDDARKRFFHPLLRRKLWTARVDHLKAILKGERW